MSHVGTGYDINQTFIIEPLDNNIPLFSACTALYTNNILSCSGNTQIFLDNGVITFDGNLYTNDDLTANTINASTYYSGGTSLIDIIRLKNVTGGTFNNTTDTLTLFKQDNSTVVVTGFTDYFTTGATLIGTTVYFDRNDTLSAYTLNLSNFSADTYVTGVTFVNNQLIIGRNDGVNLNTFINTFTGLTVNGVINANSIIANNISATTISASTFYGDGSNLTGISTQDTRISGFTYAPNTFTIYDTTGGTYSASFNTVSGLTVNGQLLGNSISANTISAITFYGDGSNLTGLLTQDTYVTGGTYTNGAALFTNNTGGTFNVNGFYTGSTDVFVTGGTYSNGTTIFTNNTGGTFSVNGYFTGSTDVFTTGITLNPSNYNLSLTRNDGVVLTTSLGILSNDVTITGGTYNPNNGIATFTNNTGGTFSVSGFMTGYTDVTVTAFTYNNSNSFKIDTSNGSSFTATINSVTGLTVNGSLSATTYLGLPIDIFVTGGTYSNGSAIFKNNTGGTFTVSGFNTNDTFITGGTYSSGTAVFTNNTGGTFNVTGFSTSTGSSFTGGTVSGATVFTNGLTANTFSATSITADTFYNNGIDMLDALYHVQSTGVDSFTGLTTASTTTFNVAPVHGYIANNANSNNIIIEVNYSGVTNKTTPYLNTDVATYVLVSSASTLVLQNTYPTPQQRRENIFLGRIAHPNKTSIVTANNTTDFVFSSMSALRDMFTAIPLINQNIVISPNGANLSINNSAGTLWGMGINFYSNSKNPDSISISASTPINFQYRTQTGGTYSNTTTLDVGYYDNSGVRTAIVGTKATNQRVYLFPNGQYRLQYGQTIYNNLTAAVSAVLTEPFVTFSNNRDNAILIGVISVQTDCSDLTNTSKAYLNSVSRFGELLGGTGGLSTTTLQQAYNNSSNPEIVINSTLDGLSIQNGTGNSDATTNLLEGKNTAGDTTSFITASGSFSGFSVSALTITTPSVTANASGLSATTISATTYLGLPTDTRVTGGTYSSGTAVFTNNTGGTFNVTGFSTSTGTSFTGGTVSGNTVFTNGLTATTISATTYLNTPYWTSGSTGSFSIKAKNNSSVDATGNYSLAEGYATTASGVGAHAEGGQSTASGIYAHGEGYLTTASGDYSHAEGQQSTSVGDKSHAEGYGTTAIGDSSHAEGSSTTASGIYSHAEGNTTTAIGVAAHSEGHYTIASGNYGSHSEGFYTTAQGQAAHAEGWTTTASGDDSHAEGFTTIAQGESSHAEGRSTTASGLASHAEGNNTIAQGESSHAEGNKTTAIGPYSHAEGEKMSDTSNHFAYGVASHIEGGNNIAYGSYNHAEGTNNLAIGIGTHVEGYNNKAGSPIYPILTYAANQIILTNDYTTEFSVGDVIGLIDLFGEGLIGGVNRYLTLFTIANIFYSVGPNKTVIDFNPSLDPYSSSPLYVINLTKNQGAIISAHAEGQSTTASGLYSHSEGYITTASGESSHAEGYITIASGFGSHAEGYYTTASGDTSHAEGWTTTASGDASHAEGESTIAQGRRSHAEGWYTVAIGEGSHAEGYGTTASGSGSHAEGYYTTAQGRRSHAEGESTTAEGDNSHAGGALTVASGGNSFVHGSSSQALGTNTVVFGDNIIGTADNTVYVPYFNIQYLSGGTSVNNLGIDANGYVVAGTAGGGTFTGGTVSGATRFTNGVTASTLTVTGSTILSGSTTLNNGFNTISYNNGYTATIPTGSYTVNGMTNLNGIISVTGNTSIYGSLSLTGNTKLSGSVSASTLTLTSVPVNDDTTTQILSRDAITGNIEYVNYSAITAYNYGLSFAMANAVYLT